MHSLHLQKNAFVIGLKQGILCVEHNSNERIHPMLLYKK
jgi:hypothetical protein